MPFTASNQVFAMVDGNNFYASCEGVFQPSLKGKPVVVLSNNDGCIIARSNEAKTLGIRMGAPFHTVRDLIQRGKVKVFSANFILYGDLSARMMHLLGQFTPHLEIYSIDEAFLDLTGFQHLGLRRYGQDIKRSIQQWTGIPISVGVASTKTLAKLANHIAKKSAKANGVLDLTRPQYIERALSLVTVGDVWGIGRRYGDRLKGYGIHTALDLSRAKDDWLMKTFPVSMMRTVLELRGINCIKLESQVPHRKSIVVSRSFGALEPSLSELMQSVAAYTARAAERLREAQLATSMLSVFIRTNSFREYLPQYSNSALIELAVPTQSTSELIQAAQKALTRIYREGYEYHKAGVMLLNLVPASQIQQSLFDTVDRQKSERLMTAIDQINTDFGSGTLQFAAEGLRPRWRMKQERRSPRYTPSWEELAIVKA
jgi:DNA polymerase V